MPCLFRPSLLAWVTLTALAALTTQAAPLLPADDAQVIEHLPRSTRTSQSTDPQTALRQARSLLAAAREAGDPRLAGRGLARLARWDKDLNSPLDIQVTLADIEQHLHQFDPALARLQAVLARDPRQAQAWLMLATLHRVQGRYAESDRACAALAGLRVQPHASACAAENAGLRGEHAAARQQLQALLAATQQPATRGWLWTTLAELEQRAGAPAQAQAAWQQALAAAADGYARLAYADFLLQQQRAAQAFEQLRDQPRTDAVLLRQAIAARRARLAQAAELTDELRQRMAQAALRNNAAGHEREKALMALDLDDDGQAALVAARLNVQAQREPIDIWLLARSAAAAGDKAALAQARALAQSMGLRDVRLDTL